MANRHTLRTFYILIATQTFSLIGSQMTGLAVAIKVFKDTNQATPIAITAFFAALPALISASIAGVLADRWDRRRVMAISDAGQAIGTLILLISFATGTFELWILYVVSLIQAVFGTFQQPAFGAAMTMMVPDDHRDRANAIRELTGPMSGIFAPVLAGLLFAVIGASGVMVIDLFTFAVAVMVVLLVEIPHPQQSAEGRALQETVRSGAAVGPQSRLRSWLAPSVALWKEATIGFRYLATRRILLFIAMYLSIVNFLIGGAFVLNTPYVLSITGKEAALGTLMGVMSAGAILGGVIMSVWGGTRPRIHTIMPGIAAAGLGMALYGVSRVPVTMGIALFALMLPIPMINASFMSMMQIKVPPDLQGRVFSVLGQLSTLLMPIAYLLAGPLADKVFEPAVSKAGWDTIAPLVGSQPGSGIGLIMLLAGSLIAVVTVIAYALPAVRHMETTLPDYQPVASEAVPQEQSVSLPAAAEAAAR
jgi:MFS transporter, DHA3 family, macrolide efflux protein